jgi:hypothetical protein
MALQNAQTLDVPDRYRFNPWVGDAQERTMTFRIAIVQPISHPPVEDERNVEEAAGARPLYEAAE